MPEPKLDRLATYGGKGFWIRAEYREGFKNRTITAVIRPGDRSNPKDPRNNPRGVDLPVRFIRIPGEPSLGIDAQLFPDDGTTVRITGCIVKRIRELTTDDLRGTAPDTATPELVQKHLVTIYNTPLPSPDDIVTIFRFEYAPNCA